MKHTLILLFALVAFAQCNLEKINDQTGPNAQFTLDKTTCDAPCTITITNMTTEATSFSWNFGDNTTSTEENPPAHLYANAGNYTIRLIATGEGNRKDTATMQVSIVNAGVKPVPSFTITNNGCTAPCTISFTNTTTNGATYRWDFGDPTSATNTSIDISTTHKFEMPGSYAVKLVATNGSLKDSVTQIVSVSGVKFQSGSNTIGPLVRMRQTADGGYIGVGTNSTNGSVYLVRLDVDGTIVGQQEYTISNTDQAADVIQLSDGTFVVVGTSYNAATSNSDCFYLRTDASLTALVGPIRIGEAVRSEDARCVIELNDGTLLIGGSSYDPNTNSSDAYVLRYNVNLTTEYFKKIIVGTDDEYISDAVEFSNGYMLVGYVYFQSSGQTDGFVMKIDANGNKSSGFPKKTGFSGSDQILAATKTGTNELVMVGLAQGNGLDACYQKVDNNGTFIGTLTLSNKAGDDAAGDVTIDAQGNIAMTGVSELSAFFYKLSATGSVLIDKPYQLVGDDGFSSIQATTDGGFIMAGYKGGGWYYVKTDKDGNFN
jgi:PKD repeat protein